MCRHANESNSQLEIDYRTLTATTEAQLSDLRNRLKMKSFEHERVAVELEEKRGMFKQTQLEAERWTKKCAFLKEEYYTLKTESATRITELEARVGAWAFPMPHIYLGYPLNSHANSRETELKPISCAGTTSKQLEHYELIEAELDNAILVSESSP